jgi:hypothetical protein
MSRQTLVPWQLTGLHEGDGRAPATLYQRRNKQEQETEQRQGRKGSERRVRSAEGSRGEQGGKNERKQHLPAENDCHLQDGSVKVPLQLLKMTPVGASMSSAAVLPSRRSEKLPPRDSEACASCSNTLPLTLRHVSSPRRVPRSARIWSSLWPHARSMMRSAT